MRKNISANTRKIKGCGGKSMRKTIIENPAGTGQIPAD
jgi:hypothetical protein